MCLKICFDRVVERNSISSGINIVMEAWGLRNGWWTAGQVITYKFLDKNARQQKEFIEVFREFESFANLKFQESSGDALLRISFNPNLGSWSYVGNVARTLDKNKPTTNIGWYGKGVKRHELGHFVGLGHEHQNPLNAIKWNKEEVYKIMAGAPNYWSKARTDHNFFRKYNKSQIIGTSLDVNSIMMYAIHQSMTLDGFSTKANGTYSSQDKSFLGGNIYPFKDVVKDPIEVDLRREVASVLVNPKTANQLLRYQGARMILKRLTGDLKKGAKSKLIDEIFEVIRD